MPTTDSSRPSAQGTLAFFLPLALTSAMTMVSHSLISAGLARTVDPAASLAAYSVALAAEDIFESPIIQTRQMSLALLGGPRSFRIIARVAATALAVSLALGLLVAATPIGPLVFARLLGVPGELLPSTIGNFWIVMLLPLLAGARSFLQGVVIKHRQTAVITAAMVGRVALMAGFIYACGRWGWVKGGYIGSVALVVGVVVELVAAATKASQLLRDGSDEDTVEMVESGGLTYCSAWRFYYPLAIAAVLASTAKPWITAGIARGTEAVTALAAYSVAWSVGSIIIGPMQNIHQVTLVLGRGADGDRHVRRFALSTGFLAASLLLVLSLSPLGRFALTDWIGVSDTLLTLTLTNLRMLAVLPLIHSVVEYLTGWMLARSHTRVISAAKVANLLATMTAVTFLAGRSAVVGPLALAIGAATECAALTWGWWRGKEVAGLHQGDLLYSR